MHTTYLALGTNIGDRASYLNAAVEAVSRKIGTVEQISSIYQTAAWGVENQADFYNQVIEVKTTLLSLKLLEVCQAIEQELGRVRKEKWGPRVIDIDILSYDNQIIKSPDLTVPHPLMQARNFVLVPLQEIAEDWIHPIYKKSIGLLTKECNDPLEVVKL